MATPQEQQIIETRKQFEEQQRQLEAAKQQEVQAKRVAFTSRQERTARETQRRAVTSSQQQISKQQQEFETQVARAGLGIAKPEVLEKQYQEATKVITSKISSRENSIKQKENYIKKLEQEKQEARNSSARKSINEDIKDYENEIKDLKAEVRGYKEGLGGDKSTVVKKYYSGQTSALAGYYSSKSSAKQQKTESRKKYSEQLEQTQSKLAQQGKTLVYDKGKWTGEYYNKGDLPSELRNTKITTSEIEQYKVKIESEQAQVEGTKTKVKVPSGWYTEEILNIHKDFANSNPSMTWEQIISNPDYQKQVQEIASRQESRTSMKEFAERRNLLGEGYGEDITVSKLTPIQSFELSEKAKKARSLKTPTFLEPIVYKTEQLAPYIFTAPTLFGPGPDVVSAKALYQSIPEEKRAAFYEKVKEDVSGGIGLAMDTLTFKGPRKAFVQTVKDVYGAVPENVRKKINLIVTRDINIPLTSITGAKISFKEFATSVKKTFTDEQERVIVLAKDLTDKAYGKSFSNLVYKKYEKQLTDGIITWEKAVDNTSKTKDWKNLEKDYQKYFDNQIKETKTGLSIAGEIAIPFIDIAPKTYGELGVASALIGTGAVITAPIVAAGFLASKPITNISNMLYSAYEPTTRVGRFAKASVFSAAITGLAPIVGVAYGAELGKGIVTKPTETTRGMLDFLTERPEELVGFAIGGGLVTRGLRYAELKARGFAGRAAKTKKIILEGYGEVTVLKVPKYGEVVWVKGAFAASEKIAIMKQVNKLLGSGKRIFVQVSPQGIPVKIFANRKGAGFEVTTISKPMRGLYEAPPATFLKKYGLETMAPSFYSELGGRERLLPDPVGFLEILTGKAKISKKRAFIQLRRTFGEIKLPKWIAEATDAILGKNKIPKGSLKTMKKYYNEFLKEKITFNGKDYIGKAKLNLVNQINLKGTGKGQALEYYAAMLQYQAKFKLQLPGGAEVLSGINPYGPEGQLVSGIGTRFFEKSIVDLRKGTQPSIGGKLLEFFTGTKRGEVVAMVDGKLVEIQPVRAFAGKVKIKGKGNVADILTSQLTETSASATTMTEGLIGEIVSGIRERRVGARKVSAPRPIFTLTELEVEPEVKRRELEETRVERYSLTEREVRETRREQVRVTKARPRKEPQRDRVRPEIRDFLIERRPKPRREREPIRRREPIRDREPPVRPRQQPPRRPPEIFRDMLYALPKKKKVKKKGKKKVVKKDRRYKALPTAFEAVLGIAPSARARKRIYTGFEALRFN